MYGGDNSGQGGGGFASLGVGNLGSQLSDLLLSNDSIVPGSPAGYEMCKTILAYHPLGLMLASAPIRRAQSQERIISVPIDGEDRIVKQFRDTWDTIGKLGGTEIIHTLMMQARGYGVTTIGVGERGSETKGALDLDKIKADNLYFNILDPLNTAGSLVLSQDPNSPDYQKQGAIGVQGKPWHPSRTLSVLNEQPLYIEWTDSAFGFVGRSVYQRALYSLRTYLQIMIAIQWIAVKCGLIVWNAESPASVIDDVMQWFGAMKRTQIKAGATGNVLQIGPLDKLESLNMEHINAAIETARLACLKDIASETGMPASIIAQETLTAGFGEGTEDAKKEAAYLNHIRETMAPAYAFLDRIVMRVAWTPEFFEALKKDSKGYRNVKYETALADWIRLYDASWPNILEEPESEKAKSADVQFKAVIASVETLGPILDPVNKTELIRWAADNFNERKELFASQLDIDVDALLTWLEAQPSPAELAAAKTPGEGEEEKPPKPFGMTA
jgi:hypothetical protein